MERQDHVVSRRLQQRRNRRRDARKDPRGGRQRGRRLLRGGHRADRRAAEGPARPRRDARIRRQGRWSSSPKCGTIVGVRIHHDGKDIRVRARAGVVLGTGGFEWDDAAGRGIPAWTDARAGVAAEQHRRRSADGDGARRRPGQHGRGVVGADHPDSRRHVRGQAPQPKRAARAHPAEKHHRQPGRQAIPQRGRRIQLDGRPVPPSRSAPRLHQRPGVDRLRLPAPQALRLPRRRPRTDPSPHWFCESRGPRRTRREDGHRRRRAGPHAGRHGTQTSPTSTIPTSAAARAPTTATGATTTPRRPRARRSGRSIRPRTMRFRSPSARWVPRAARAPTATAAFCTSAASRYRAYTRQATRWPVRPARPTGAQAGPSAPQWFSATGPDTPRRREVCSEFLTHRSKFA